MDAKEITVLSKNLDKSVREKLPPAHIADILNKLKTDVVATEQVLRETKIGMAVNKLRGHADKSISDLAKEIVLKWKKDVQSNKAKPAATASSSDSSKASAKNEVPSNGVASKASPKKEAAPTRKSSIAPGNRNKTTDAIPWEIYDDPVRDKSLGMLYDGLCVGSDETPDHILTVAKSVEAAVFKNSRGKTQDPVYRTTMRSLFLNLKDPRNPNLRKRVVTGELSPERLSTMSSEEMASSELKEEIKKIESENMANAFVPKAEKSTTDQFQCGKCKQRKVSYSQAQTRSADEPMTTFCECENCGNRWKFS